MKIIWTLDGKTDAGEVLEVNVWRPDGGPLQFTTSSGYEARPLARGVFEVITPAGPVRVTCDDPMAAEFTDKASGNDRGE